MDELYDIIIIGAGPAGITAAVYAARKQMKLLVLTGDIGGQTAWSGNIENYTGYQFISGMDLTMKFQEHMDKYGITVRENEEVTDIGKEDDIVVIKTGKGTYRAKTALISSGKRSMELGVPGEKEFRNRGVTYCATCDGPLFKGKDVAIAGGGNSALDAALQLIKIGNRIFIINIAPGLTGDPVMSRKVMESGKAEVLNNSRVTEITGDTLVRKIKVLKDGEEREIPVEGVFVEIGLIPNSAFARGIDKNESGEIRVNSYNETNLPGIFAAGDVTDVPEKQIIIAAGEGAKASLVAFRYISRLKDK
ncbi:MAG: FAD-dependent oxidoreductase [Candidatus Omnitrophota bacterium]